jgi:hypothetical protein
VFYLLGSRATKIKVKEKAKVEDGVGGGGERDAIQVIHLSRSCSGQRLIIGSLELSTDVSSRFGVSLPVLLPGVYYLIFNRRILIIDRHNFNMHPTYPSSTPDLPRPRVRLPLAPSLFADKQTFLNMPSRYPSFRTRYPIHIPSTPCPNLAIRSQGYEWRGLISRPRRVRARRADYGSSGSCGFMD